MFTEDRPRPADRLKALVGPVAIGLGVALCAFAVPAALRTPSPPAALTTAATTTPTAGPVRATPSAAPAVVPDPTPSPTPSAKPSRAPAAAEGPVLVGLGDTGISTWYAAFCTAESARLRGCSSVGDPDTGSAVLSNTYTDVLPVAPDLVLLADGNADILAGVNPGTTIANLTVVINGLLKQKLSVVLVTVLPDDAHAAAVAAMNESLRGLAQRADVPLLDLAAISGTDGGRWTAGLSDDGRTPNAEGISRLVAAAVAHLATSARA